MTPAALLFLASAAVSQQPADSAAVARPFHVGQRFQYAAKLGFLRLGTAWMSVNRIDTLRGNESFVFEFGLEASAPFYKSTSVMQSWTGTGDLISRRFTQDIVENGRPTKRHFDFYPDSLFYTQEERPGRILSSSYSRAAQPVDMIGFATEEQHAQAVATMLRADEIDALIIVHVSVRAKDNVPVAAGIIRGIRVARQAVGIKKPVYVCWMAEGDLDRPFTVGEETIPTYQRPEIPARIISQAVTYDDWRRQPAGQSPRYSEVDLSKIKAICAKAVSERGSGWLATDETHALLTAMQLPLVQGGIATSSDDVEVKVAQWAINSPKKRPAGPAH